MPGEGPDPRLKEYYGTALEALRHACHYTIGVGKGVNPPRPPNRACGFPAHGSPVAGSLIGGISRLQKLPEG